MGRKQKEINRDTPPHIGEKTTFASRLTKLIQKKKQADKTITQETIAQIIGVKRQTVSLYTKGQALPDISTLGKLCDYFNVTADYLLGRTSEPTINTEIRAICDYTGLKIDSVKELNFINTHKDNSEDLEYAIVLINALLAQDVGIHDLSSTIQDYVSSIIYCKCIEYSNKDIDFTLIKKYKELIELVDEVNWEYLDLSKKDLIEIGMQYLQAKKDTNVKLFCVQSEFSEFVKIFAEKMIENTDLTEYIDNVKDKHKKFTDICKDKNENNYNLPF